MDDRILMVCLGLLILIVVLSVAFSVSLGRRGDRNGYRNKYLGNSVEKEANKRFIYTPTQGGMTQGRQPPPSPAAKALVDQPSQIRYGGIIPVDYGMNEYQASAYPVFMLNQKKIGLNPAEDQEKIDKFYAEYRIGGGRDLDTQLHHDAIAAIKPNYAIYS